MTVQASNTAENVSTSETASAPRRSERTPSSGTDGEIMAQNQTNDGSSRGDAPRPRPAPRGFAAMDAARQREIASKGGKASGGNFANDPGRAAAAGRKGGESVPREKRSFSQNPELAAEAGRKGGRSVPAEKRSFSQDPELAAQAGRKGGQASGGNFANDRQRAAEAGRRGGHGGTDTTDGTAGSA